VCRTTAGGVPDVAPALGVVQQSELPHAQTAHHHRSSPCGPWSAVESRKSVFFLAGLFYFYSHGKKGRKLGGGGTLTETGNRNKNIRKQNLFPNVSETRSRNTKEKPIADMSKRVFMNEISRSVLLDIQLTLLCVCGVDSFLPELEHL